MAGEPLIINDVRLMGEQGMDVLVRCPEPGAWCCLTGSLRGPTFVVNAAIERLEAIHQSAHALRGEP